MTNNGVGFDKICRFCGFEKNVGKFLFSSEAVKIGLLSKIKQLFPEEVSYNDITYSFVLIDLSLFVKLFIFRLN